MRSYKILFRHTLTISRFIFFLFSLPKLLSVFAARSFESYAVKMNFKTFFISLFLIFSFCDCARILIVFPSLSVSHVIPLQTLAKLLAEKDHKVTFVSAFPQTKPIKNYRDIKIPYNEADKAFVTEVAKDPKGASMLKMITG